MADVSVTRAQREELLSLRAQAPVLAAVRSLPALPRSLVILWAGIVLGTAGFLLAGRLRIGAGNWIGRRMPAREIWGRFIDFLSDLGATAPLVLLVTASAIVTLVVAAVALWLAFALRDAPADTGDTPAEM